MAAVSKPAPKPPRSSSLSKQHGDVLVLGHSLAAAIAATRLVKDGWHVLWPGAAPAVQEKVGSALVPVAPGLAPSLAHMPHLAHALRDLGLEADAKKLFRPVSLQILSDGRRETIAADQLASAKAPAEAAEALWQEPLDMGFFAASGARRRLASLSALEAPSGKAAEVSRAVETVLGARDDDRSAWLVTAAPHDLVGGAPALVSLLHKRFLDLGGWSHGELSRPLESVSLSASDVKVTLADGETQSARLLLTGLDAGDLARVLPEDEARLRPKITVDSHPLRRLSLVVKTRGLPVALGPVAFIDGRWLVERRAAEADAESLNVFWRAGEGSAETESERALERLRAMLPFFEKHLVARSLGTVPHHDRFLGERSLRPRWRALQADGPLLDASGFDGAARLGEAIARRAKKLVPRKDLLK